MCWDLRLDAAWPNLAINGEHKQWGMILGMILVGASRNVNIDVRCLTDSSDRYQSWHHFPRVCLLFVCCCYGRPRRHTLSSASRLPRQSHYCCDTPLHNCGIPHAPRGPVLARCVLPAWFPPRTFLDAGHISSGISHVLC